MSQDATVSALPELVPGIHVLAAEITKAPEDVDAGPSPAKGIFGCVWIVGDNQIPSTGQPWIPMAVAPPVVDAADALVFLGHTA